MTRNNEKSNVVVYGGSGKLIAEIPFSVEDVLRTIDNRPLILNIDGAIVRLGKRVDQRKRKKRKRSRRDTSIRSLKTFIKKGIQCIGCGVKGEKFFVFLAPEGQHFVQLVAHIGISSSGKDKYVILTKDHIKARSDGGSNSFDNYQIMCCICNNKKGSFKDDVEGIIRALNNRTYRYIIG